MLSAVRVVTHYPWDHPQPWVMLRGLTGRVMMRNLQRENVLHTSEAQPLTDDPCRHDKSSSAYPASAKQSQEISKLFTGFNLIALVHKKAICVLVNDDSFEAMISNLISCVNSQETSTRETTTAATAATAQAYRREHP